LCGCSQKCSTPPRLIRRRFGPNAASINSPAGIPERTVSTGFGHRQSSRRAPAKVTRHRLFEGPARQDDWCGGGADSTRRSHWPTRCFEVAHAPRQTNWVPGQRYEMGYIKVSRIYRGCKSATYSLAATIGPHIWLFGEEESIDDVINWLARSQACVRVIRMLMSA
jgi:hypothetical protein